MTYRVVLEEIRNIISHAIENTGLPELGYDISQPPRREYGDLTCNVAFLVAKKVHSEPFIIAKSMVHDQINPYLEEKKRNRSVSFVDSVEPHTAGYINFRINIPALADITLTQVLTNPRYGFYDAGKGKSVILEHTSVNPNKALHVGHLRNLVIGDTLYRLMKWTNYEPIVLNYIDDSGVQVADLVVGFLFAGFPLVPSDGDMKFDQYCGDVVYVKVNDLYKRNPLLAEKRNLVLREMEGGSSDIAKFSLDLTRRVLMNQLKTCWRLKARYDLLNFESQIIISKLWNSVFKMLRDKAIIFLETEGKNKGCWMIRQHVEYDKIIVRSDGTATYIAKDIPYAAWKLGLVPDPFYYSRFALQWDGTELWATTLVPDSKDRNHQKFDSADIVITIIDSRQARLQRIISNIMSTLLGACNKIYHHLGYEAITLSSNTAKMLRLDIGDKDFAQMSGRKGIYVNADYVLDALHSKASEEIKKRNSDFGDDEISQIAEDIAISAMRYNLIKQDLDKIITFDILDSLSLEGDTGPYLQYAYARSQRILEKSPKYTSVINFALLSARSEISLVKEIAKFDLILEEASRTMNPKLVARYAYTLAASFNLLYEQIPVLKESDLAKMNARLALTKAFGTTMKNVFKILGIEPLTKM